MKKLAVLMCLVVSVLCLCVGCGKSEDKKAVAKPVKVTMAAAASLEKAFSKELIPAFQKQHPEITIEGTYDSSGKLQAQIEQGLAADIFFSAATKQMNALKDKGYMNESTITPFLENKLVLIVPAAGKSPVTGFDNLALAKSVALGDPKIVPAGQYAKIVLDNLQMWSPLEGKISFGSNVTEVLHWVAAGSAEAGMVYATDAASTDKVKVVAAADKKALPKPIIYPIGILKKAPQPKEAQLFLDFLKTDEAKKTFEKYGFAMAK